MINREADKSDVDGPLPHRYAGLPVAVPPDHLLQASPPEHADLLRQLRANGFTLEAMVPACLHPESVGLTPEFMQMAVRDQAEWSEFLDRQGFGVCATWPCSTLALAWT